MLTLACLAAFHACRKPEGLSFDVVLVDDGSTDGTGEAVAEAYPNTTILRRDGMLFWNRGMHCAFQWALDRGYDYYLWLNDDTILFENALELLLVTDATVRDGVGLGIVVGSTYDAQTGALTYGGLVGPRRWRPLKFDPIEPGSKPIACDTMNGNCVLIPAEVAVVVGNLDYAFEHSMGDFDYALRARRNGFPIWIAPGYVGSCKRNVIADSFLDQSLPLDARFRSLTKRKSLPPRAWAIFARRYAGPCWPVYWAWPYLRVIFSSLFVRKHRFHQHSP